MPEPKTEAKGPQRPPQEIDKVTYSKLKSGLHPFLKPMRIVCDPAIPIPASEVKKLPKIVRPDVMEDRWTIIPEGPDEKSDLFYQVLQELIRIQDLDGESYWCGNYEETRSGWKGFRKSKEQGAGTDGEDCGDYMRR